MRESKRQLEELLDDPAFQRALEMLAKEIVRKWHLSYPSARGFVLSAIGEPTALNCIYCEWVLARSAGKHQGRAMLIMRRRVLDLLAKEARRANHESLAQNDNEVTDTNQDSIPPIVAEHSPHTLLERWQVSHMVQRAIACFGAQGIIQHRQAALLRRHILDGIGYMELGAELACTQVALRVRLHKALNALRRHVLKCHPELTSMRDGLKPSWGL